MSSKKRKTIKSRWVRSIFAVTVSVLLLLAATIVYSVYSRCISNAELTVRARISSSVDTYFSNYNKDDETYFALGANEFVKNFAHKDLMEVLVLDKNGNTVISSNVFGASATEENKDYQQALSSESKTGTAITKTVSGEQVYALTYALKGEDGVHYGALRYFVSLEDSLEQLEIITLIILLIFILIIALITVLGKYFVSSIVQPVEKINEVTKVIARGDFTVRLASDSDDELGELSESINEMAERLNETDKMKNEFISTVSHEIRTPLTAIKGWGETLKKLNNDPTLTEKGLDIIINETERLSEMVEELLDFSRVRNADLKIDFCVFDLCEVVDDVFFSYKQRAENENKKFENKSEKNDRILINGDKGKIRQVLINIIDNALKYSDNNAHIKIGLERNKKYVKIYLVDNGRGISQKDLPHVKEKFFKADNTVRGTGIGLAVADEIINKHGGSMDIYSELGNGTRVELNLPIYNPEE